MVRRAIVGPVQRAITSRIQQEYGDVGELIWANLVSGDRIGHRRYPSWRGQPPIDVVAGGIGYSVKVGTQPNHRYAFSGAHREVVGRTIAGLEYRGTPEDKLAGIDSWIRAQGWSGALIIFLFDEDANRAVVYAKRCVCNAIPSQEMDVIGTFDNDTGTFHGFEDIIRALDLPIPAFSVGLPTFPRVPEELRTTAIEPAEVRSKVHVTRVEDGEQMRPFRRVGVRRHARGRIT